MATVARSIRIEEELWQESFKKAKEMGISLTVVIKSALQNFSKLKDPIIIIDEGAIILDAQMQKRVDHLAQLADQRVRERLSKKV